MNWEEKSYWRSSCWRWWPSARVQQRGRWAMMKNLKKRTSTSKDRFPKILFALSLCRITKEDSFRDLLFWSQMHINEWGEVALMMQQWRRQKTRCIAGSWLFILTSSVAAARIYRDDLPRVTASRNRLGLSLSKHIRHGLVAKINGKRRSWTCEALDRISMDYSRAHLAPAPIASPCHAPPRPTRRDERAHMSFSLSPLLHTLASA
jgi:hypothetical protein